MTVDTDQSGIYRKLKSQPLQDLIRELATSQEGLDKTGIEDRLKQYGYNEIPEKKPRPFLKFLTYFWGPIPWMIETAAVLSAIVHHWPDFTIILVLLLANASVGFWEEYQAGNAIASLKARLALNARVRRSAEWISIPARELVPGDVIRIRLGDIVPADARIMEGGPVEVDQSALTGESLTVTCDKGDAVYSGSIIRRGVTNAVVYGTGLNTYFGERVFHLDRNFIQTLIYLKLSVAGHLTIFITRTRRPFWSIRPARILILAVLGTQMLATLLAVYGFLMPPIGWNWALAVWAYPLLWFVINDGIKLAAYRILNSNRTLFAGRHAG